MEISGRQILYLCKMAGIPIDIKQLNTEKTDLDKIYVINEEDGWFSAERKVGK